MMSISFEKTQKIDIKIIKIQKEGNNLIFESNFSSKNKFEMKNSHFNTKFF